MNQTLTALAVCLLCSCAAPTSTKAVESPTTEQILLAQKQTALRRLGEEREGVRQTGAAILIVVCLDCNTDSRCDESSKMRALAMQQQTCPSGRAHVTDNAAGTVRSAQACAAKCYRFEMPSDSFACE
ncbi:MAG: hypothetical protein WC551_01410 [Patescibacteria group bacterium]